MESSRDVIFSVRITRPSLERLSEAELDEAARGVFFVPSPTPPRVGARIRVDVTVGENAASRQDGLVIWSRPARRGQIAGFRARLENPSPTLIRRLKSTIEALRGEGVARQPISIDEPILERVSAKHPVVLPPVGEDIDLSIETDRHTTESHDASEAQSRTRIRKRKKDQLTLPPPLLLLPGPPGRTASRR